MITVTKPFLPPKEEYFEILNGIWERNWLTNHGPIVTGLEEGLKKYLNVSQCNFVTNGTIALQIAIKALDLKGEIITTPFSYVATTSSIVWEGCKVVFADIDKDSYNIDPDTIEPLINENTCAIMATHVFGNPCDVLRIEEIAKKHELKVIYDAAHAFGVKYEDRSIFEFGDISTASFHATKLFHTVEGGAIFASNEELLHRVKYMRNFGHNGKYEYHGLGINGKNSEFHAAMGMAILPHMENIIQRRKELFKRYQYNLNSENVTFQKINPTCSYNYAYFPILLENNSTTQSISDYLEDHQVYTRRYFRPSLSSLPYTKDQLDKTPVSNQISDRILCLPLYDDLRDNEVDHVCNLIKQKL